jgi:hypothetical protein
MLLRLRKLAIALTASVALAAVSFPTDAVAFGWHGGGGFSGGHMGGGFGGGHIGGFRSRGFVGHGFGGRGFAGQGFVGRDFHRGFVFGQPNWGDWPGY